MWRVNLKRWSWTWTLLGFWSLKASQNTLMARLVFLCIRIDPTFVFLCCIFPPFTKNLHFNVWLHPNLHKSTLSYVTLDLLSPGEPATQRTRPLLIIRLSKIKTLIFTWTCKQMRFNSKILKLIVVDYYKHNKFLCDYYPHVTLHVEMKITCLVAIWAPMSRQTQMNYVLRINHTNISHSIALKYGRDE